MDDLDKRILELLAKLEQKHDGERISNSNLPKILEGIDEYYAYSPKEVASILGFDVHTVTRWCREGKIRATQGGGYRSGWRIYGDEVKRLILKDMRKPSFLDKLTRKPADEDEE